MFTPFTIEKVRTNISRIKRSAASLQKLIHETACSCLVHIRDHGDYTPLVQLLDALPTGQRVKQLAQWSSHFTEGAVKLTYDSGSGWACKLAKHRTPEMFDIEGAYATPYGDLAPEKVGGTMTLKAVVRYLKRKADEDKRNDDGTPKVSDEARELFATLYVKATELHPELS